MSFRTTYILLAVVGLLLLGLTGTLVFSDKAAQEGYLLGKLYASGTRTADIDTFEIEWFKPEPKKAVFVRTGQREWKLVTPVEARVNSVLVEEIVREFLNVKRETKSAELTKNLSLHGLDAPAVKLTFKRGSQETTIALGNVSLAGPLSVLYVLSSDDNNVPAAVRKAAVRTLFREDLSKGLQAANTGEQIRSISEFRSLELLGAGLASAADEATGLKLTQGSDVLELKRDSKQSAWVFVVPAGWGRAALAGGPGGFGGLRPTLSLIGSLRVASANEFNDAPGDLEQYGLTAKNPNLLRIDFTRPTGLAGTGAPITETLFVGNADPKNPGKTFVRVEGEKWIAAVTTEDADCIRSALKDKTVFRDRNLMYLGKESIDALDVTTVTGTLKLRRFGEKRDWHIFGAAGTQPVKANPTVIDELLTKLLPSSNPNELGVIKSFATDSTQYESEFAADKRLGELKIWQAGILPDAKKDEKAPPTEPQLKPEPTVTLIFAQPKDFGVPVRKIEGQTSTDVVLGTPIADLVKRDRIDYIDVSVATFDPTTVTKFRLVRHLPGKPEEVIEIERQPEGSPHPWKLVTPPSRKDRPADNSAVGVALVALSRLQVLKVVAETGTPASLDPRGLRANAPQIEATVYLGGNEIKRTYRLGAATDDGAGYYAQQEGLEPVFTVAKGDLEILRTKDFQDLTILKLPVNDILSVKLSGWYSLNENQVRVREIRREENSFKLNVTYTAEQADVGEFVQSLASLRATAILTPQEVQALGVNPLLDPKNDALVIEIGLRGNETVTLTVGGLDREGKNYFATSTTTGELIFLVEKSLFEKLRGTLTPFLRRTN